MRRVHPLLIPVLVAVVVLGGLAALALTRTGAADPAPVVPSPSPSGASTAPAGPDPSTGPVPDRDVTVRLVADGWTVRTLAGVDLAAVDARGRSVPVRFVPLTGDALTDVTAAAPDALVGPLARVLPADADLACTADGCTWDGAPVPAGWFTDPATVPGLGPVYAGWGVDSLLWTATVTVDTAIGPFRLEADGWSSPPFGTVADPGDDPVSGTVDGAAAGPASGFGVGVYPVAAGLGRVFTPAPAWVGASATLGFVDVDGPVPPADGFDAPVLFLDGLSTPAPAAATLSEPALTYLTAPATGCGVGVLCTPDPVPVTVDVDVPAETFTVCVDETPVNRVVIGDVTWMATFPHPTHQFGVWGTVDGLVTFGTGGLVAGVPGLTPAGSPVEVRTITLAYFAGTGPDAALTKLVGLTAERGVDDDFTVDRDAWLADRFAGPELLCGN